MSDIEKRVVKVVASQLGLDEEKVTLESNFKDDLGADSLDTVEMVMALEDEFEVQIDDTVAEKLISVKQVVEHLATILPSN